MADKGEVRTLSVVEIDFLHRDTTRIPPGKTERKSEAVIVISLVLPTIQLS